MDKFYKHTYTVTVLSESPVQSDLEDLNYDVTHGEDNLYNLDHEVMELTAQEAAKMLIESGSDAEFFGLDEAGNSVNRL